MALTIPLSPVDYVFTGPGAYPIEFLFRFSKLPAAGLLEESLNDTLQTFAPLRGTLRQTSDRDMVFETSERHFEFAQVSHNEAFESDAPLGEHRQFLSSVRSLPDEAMLRIRLTHTPSETLLAVSASHAVVDGYSYFLFLNAWAQRCRKSGAAVALNLDRRVLQPTEPSEASAPTPDEFFARTGFTLSDQPRTADTGDGLEWTRVELPTELIRPRDGFTANDLAAAFLWQSCFHRWGDVKYPRTRLGCPVDYRRFLKSAGASYFGNAVRGAGTEMTADEMAGANLTDVAAKVRAAVRCIREDAARDSLRALATLRARGGLEVFRNVHAADPKGGLLVTNLSRLNFADLDFGFGPPSDFFILTPVARGGVLLTGTDGNLFAWVAHPPSG